jgi:hypothetical protein
MVAVNSSVVPLDLLIEAQEYVDAGWYPDVETYLAVDRERERDTRCCAYVLKHTLFGRFISWLRAHGLGDITCNRLVYRMFDHYWSRCYAKLYA